MPELATELRLDEGERAPLRSRLSTVSRSAQLGPYQPVVDLLPDLRRIDRAALPPPEKAWLDTIIWSGERAREAARFDYCSISGRYPVPYRVTQLTGSYLEVPRFLTSSHPIGSHSDVDAYFSRLDQFAANLMVEAGLMREDARRGAVPPSFIIDKTLTQLRLLRGRDPGSSSLAQHLVRGLSTAGLDPGRARRGRRLLERRAMPAIDLQIAVLTELRSRGGSGRMSDLPDGRAFFDACLRHHTTTGMGAEEIHDIGLRQVAALEPQVDRLLKAEGLTSGSVGARLAMLGSRPEHLYANSPEGREALLSDLQVQVDAIRARMAGHFITVPETPIEIRRVPTEVEVGAPRAFAVLPLQKGETGSFFINLADTRIWPRWALPTLAYHETMPGHLWQAGIALENESIPPVLRMVTSLGGYTEGWGLYAEQVADELGAYDRFPLAKIGLLQSLLHRAVRVVAETGLHSRGWSRAQAIRHLVDGAGISEALAANEVDRYVVWPGQGCSYTVGQTGIARLRESARARLGRLFDLRSFHHAVLANGAVSLTALDGLVEAWAQSRLGSAPP